VIVAGSLHGGRHQRRLLRFVRDNLVALARLPTAFLSVSLSATGSDFPGARRCADAFLAETGWRPDVVRLVAGALMYSRYGIFKRWMMRRIAAKAGGDTDTSRDYEYTDWPALRREVEAFLLLVVDGRAPVDAREDVRPPAGCARTRDPRGEAPRLRELDPCSRCRPR